MRDSDHNLQSTFATNASTVSNLPVASVIRVPSGSRIDAIRAENVATFRLSSGAFLGAAFALSLPLATDVSAEARSDLFAAVFELSSVSNDLALSGSHWTDDAAAFVADKPMLRMRANEAERRLAQLFQRDAQLCVECELPWEGEETKPRLVVYVKTQLSVEAARTRLDRFDEEWWLDVSPAVHDQMAVRLRFDG